MPTSNQDEDDYCVLLRRLTPGNSVIEEVGKYILKLPATVSIDDEDVIFSPKDCEGGVCGSHYLLISHFTVTLHLVPAESSYVNSKSDCVLSSTEISAELIPDGEGFHACSSSDGSVVAIKIDDEEYHVWEPDSGRIVRVLFPAVPNCYFCLAVGNLYSILGGVNVDLEPGWRVCVCSGGNLHWSHGTTVKDLRLFAPMDQSWLSTFAAPEYLPIATTRWSSGMQTTVGSVMARR